MKTSLRLRKAARRLGVSPRTLLRAFKAKRLELFMPPGSRRWRVEPGALRAAALISLGRAAELLGIHYETARRWVKRRKLKVYRDAPRSWARVSLQEIGRLRGSKYGPLGGGRGR